MLDSEDFEAVSGVVVFDVGSLESCVDIIIFDDTILEGVHVFLLQILSQQEQDDPAVIVNTGNAAVISIDDPEDGEFSRWHPRPYSSTCLPHTFLTLLCV